MARPVQFEIQTADPSGSPARVGRLTTPHGTLDTPAFMPVGTRATVKGILPSQLPELGTRMLLANTYHLALRPGETVVRDLGGLHRFMAWDGPILTDSGGFQVFSMADRCVLSEEGVRFRSHIDGALLELTPERAIQIQQDLGADVAMCLDHCPPLPADRAAIADAVGRTVRWAERCRRAHDRPDQALFAIVQGGSHEDLRASCAERLVALKFDGYAIGGVSVGESREEVHAALRVSTRHLPTEQVRYLMGVGRPQDILAAVASGIDLFDCVLPTRNGRNATCLTADGPLKLRNAAHRTDPRPIEEGCECPACRSFSRGYLRHLFLVGEMLGPILASLHNLAYLHRLTREIRESILAGGFAEFHQGVRDRLGP